MQSPTGSRWRRCNNQVVARGYSPSGSAVCTTRPRAWASTTPRPRSAAASASAPPRGRAPDRQGPPARAGRPALPAARPEWPARPGRVLLGQMTAADRRADAHLDLGDQRLAIALPHRIGLGIDRLGDHRPGEPAAAQRAGGEGRDRCGQRRQAAPALHRRRAATPRSRAPTRFRSARRPAQSCRGNSGRPSRRRCRRARRSARSGSPPCRLSPPPPRAASTMAS